VAIPDRRLESVLRHFDLFRVTDHGDIYTTTGVDPNVRAVSAGNVIALVAIVVWIGLVVAISVLEAPLGFRAFRDQPRMWPRLGWRVFATARTGVVAAAVTLVIEAKFSADGVRVF
jgi:hypothetical protein